MMAERQVARLVSLVGLLVLLAMLFVHYGAHYQAQNPYPSVEQLHADYDAHVGEPFHRWMVVEEVHDESFVATDAGLSLAVRTDVPGLKPGDVVQVYGPLGPDRTIQPERVVVSDHRNRTYMFAVSGFAALLTVGLVAREWTVDLDALCLTPRGR